MHILPQPLDEHAIIEHNLRDERQVDGDGSCMQPRRAAGDQRVQEADLPHPVDSEASAVDDERQQRERERHARRDRQES